MISRAANERISRPCQELLSGQLDDGLALQHVEDLGLLSMKVQALLGARWHRDPLQEMTLFLKIVSGEDDGFGVVYFLDRLSRTCGCILHHHASILRCAWRGRATHSVINGLVVCW